MPETGRNMIPVVDAKARPARGAHWGTSLGPGDPQDRSKPRPARTRPAEGSALGIDATDAVLVERARAGDERAWRLLVDRYAGLVYSVPRRHRLGNDQCDDVFQVTFTSLWRNLDRLRDPATLPKWLITTAYRESLRVRRTGAVGAGDPSVDREDAAPAPETDLVRGERQHALHLALTRLGGKCEPLLRALFLDPLEPNYQAISQRLGMPVGSIGPVRARCLRKLLELLRKVEGFDWDRAQ